MVHPETKNLASLLSSLGTGVGHRIYLGCCVKNRSLPYLNGKSQGNRREGKEFRQGESIFRTAQKNKGKSRQGVWHFANNFSHIFSFFLKTQRSWLQNGPAPPEKSGAWHSMQFSSAPASPALWVHLCLLSDNLSTLPPTQWSHASSNLVSCSLQYSVCWSAFHCRGWGTGWTGLKGWSLWGGPVFWLVRDRWLMRCQEVKGWNMFRWNPWSILGRGEQFGQLLVGVREDWSQSPFLRQGGEVEACWKPQFGQRTTLLPVFNRDSWTEALGDAQQWLGGYTHSNTSICGSTRRHSGKAADSHRNSAAWFGTEQWETWAVGRTMYNGCLLYFFLTFLFPTATP